MGFADGYLEKQALKDRLIQTDPVPDLNIVVAIPCYNESGLLKSLDSLFLSEVSGIKAEVIILINASESSSNAIHEQNIDTFRSLKLWISKHLYSSIRFYPLMDNRLEEKYAGVGLARKIAMDEAVRRFNTIGNPDGIILSLDADAKVRPDYLQSVLRHFNKNRSVEGCSVYYEHLLDGEEFSETVYRAISQYELHLRYYVRAIRYSGYPFAFHTVGSCFGVKASSYCRYGGMNRRQGGEDFYFIQKVAQNGRYSDCTTTCIELSPRPSDRVPFGTGPAVMKLVSERIKPLVTYNPIGFEILKRMFLTVEKISGSIEFNKNKRPGFQNDLSGIIIEKLSRSGAESQREWLLVKFLNQTGFGEALHEIIANTASPDAFMKRFWNYFNMFRILKFLNFIRENGIGDIPVRQAASEMLSMIGKVFNKDSTVEELLMIYRLMDRFSTSYHPQ